MATIRREELKALDVPTNGAELDPRKALREMGPTVKTVQESRRLDLAFSQIETLGKFDPERITLKQMQHMRRDTMIALGLWYIQAPIINAEWTIECDDPKIAGFVTGALQRIYVALIMGLLGALSFGYQPAIKRFETLVPTWTYEDTDGETKPVWDDEDIPAVIWNEPRFLHPDGAKIEFTEDGKEFDGFSHEKIADDSSGRTLRIHAKHALWFTNERVQSYGDWYGYPRTGYAFRYWWSYWYTHMLGDRHFENDADPPLVVKYPPGSSPDSNAENGERPNLDIALDVGTSIREGATIAVPSDPYINDEDGKPTGTPRWSVEFLRGGENLPAFSSRYEYLDVMKLRSMLVPEQAIIEGAKGTGARNSVKSYGEIFTRTLEVIKGDIDQVINDYMIPDLLQQNFVDPPEARIVTTGFSEEDLSLVTDLIKQLMNVDPNALNLDVSELVRKVGLPQLKAEEVDARQDAAEAEATAKAAAGAAAGADTETDTAAPEEQGASTTSPPEELGLSLPKDIPGLACLADPTIHAAAEEIETVVANVLDVIFNGTLRMLPAVAMGLSIEDDALERALEGLSIPDITEKMSEAIDRIAQQSARIEIGRIGRPTPTFGAINPAFRAKARQRAETIVDTIMGRAGSEVREAIADLAEQGMAPNDIAAHLGERLGPVIEWQARRAARSETRATYNHAALDTWESLGVKHVIASDGHGGLTGKTDPGCVARNGQRFTIDQARAEEDGPQTHPNCTLSFRPDMDGWVAPDDLELPPYEEDRLDLARRPFDEAKVKRAPKGTGIGGRFVKKVRTYLADGSTKSVEVGMRPATAEDRKARKVPAAWTDVFVSEDPEAPLQVLGKDGAGRRQPRYSAEHHSNAAVAKFARGRLFNAKRDELVKQMNDESDDTEMALRLVALQGLRPGSGKDTGAKERAYGATTLLNRHVKVDGDKVHLDFVGKSAQHLKFTIEDPVVARAIAARLENNDDPDASLFPSTSEMKMNAWVKKTSGVSDFKVKDFRTWTGTATALGMIKTMDAPTQEKQLLAMRKRVAEAVSAVLGNTPTVALKSYIDPAVFLEWEQSVYEAKVKQ